MAPLKIHLGHPFHGSGNLAGDLLLAGLLRAVERTGQAVEWTCCTTEPPESQTRRFPEITWLPCRPAVQDAAVAEADAWLGAGDTPFQLAGGPDFLQHLASEVARCRRSQVPMYFLGVGVESAAAAARRDTALILDAAECVWTRDAGSAELLRGLGTSARIIPSADLAHAYLSECAFAPPDPEEMGYILAINEASEVSDAALTALLEGAPAPRVAWLVQETRALPGTERKLHTRLPDLLQLWAEVRVPDYTRAASVGALLAPWGEPGWVCSSRNHALLIGAWAGAKLAAVAQGEEIRHVAEQLGVPVVSVWPEDSSAAKTFLKTAKRVPRATLQDLARTCEAHVAAFIALATAGRRQSSHSSARPDWRAAMAEEFLREHREREQDGIRYEALALEHNRVLQAGEAPLRDLETRLSKAESEREARVKVIKRQDARFSKLQAEHDTLRQTTAAAAAELEQRLQAAEADRAAGLQLIEEQAARHTALEAEHVRLQRESAEERSSWESRFAAAETERASHLRTIEDQSARHATLEAEHHRVLKETAERAAQLSAKLEASESERAAQRKKIEEQNAQHTALETEHASVKKSLAESQASLANREARLAVVGGNWLVKLGRSLGMVPKDQ